jgi:general secretion pathway protein F
MRIRFPPNIYYLSECSMPTNSLPNPPPITLDQLTALNDEIAALVRSGVPLETNLAEIGEDLPGTLGKITMLLAQRASRGESLPQLIAECSAQFPPVYRAVVEAGLRAGRLSAALESLSGTASVAWLKPGGAWSQRPCIPFWW